ncbi:MAG TPA: Rne/Rng family ribonuclease [Xanthobacteraceae bacterium]|nr:Rne/Rng family ribonuclease [Xanthobacteraceae bacterium]
MPNKMLVDATHPEETRVVVLRGNRVEEFDFESANRKQLRGNIYLAKVTRVEPSLQAAFVDYGGNRHGFLAFGEIHPDYYQIPVADRQALIDEEERAARAAEAEADNRAGRRHRESRRSHDHIKSDVIEPEREHNAAGDADFAAETGAMAAASEIMAPAAEEVGTAPAEAEPDISTSGISSTAGISTAGAYSHAPAEDGWQAESTTLGEREATPAGEPASSNAGGQPEPAESPIMAAEADAEAAAEPALTGDEHHAEAGEGVGENPAPARDQETADHNVTENITEIGAPVGEEEVVESVGGADAMEEVPERMPRMRRQYKIQEVIKRRQVMLVQVVKEERGTKGAALTTYLSLAGRYSVLMPNTARGGGISRKITDSVDRKRLKEVAQELEVPEGMGVILRTAGASRTKTEIKRDFEYLLRLWETVRDLTLKSTAPTLVYEEGSLVKRSIRDLYNKDIDEILVAGADAYREARDFMRMLMPSHTKNVKPYNDNVPIFGRFGIESQLDAMFQPVVQLRSGGYIVLNQAEALVAIDVNSGRATREHHIEDTALKTNLEASDEIARQLRLRDLAGLIVIDYIDMDEKRNNRTVERRLKEALKHDRARIQVGHISHFGLLEMSRQRIRSSVLESSTEKCPHCGGTGHVRSVSSVALQLLRAIEEMMLKGATHNLIVRTRSDTALYLLNHKRAHLRELEERFQLTITVNSDATVAGQVSYVIEKGEQVHSIEQAKALSAVRPTSVAPLAEEDEEALEETDELEAGGAEAESGETEEGAEEVLDGIAEAGHGEGERTGRKRRRRRRGRRGGGGDTRESEAPVSERGGEVGGLLAAEEEEPVGEADAEAEGELSTAEAATSESHGEGERRRRRRGRRGGRRNRHGREVDGHEAIGRESDGAMSSPDSSGAFAETAQPEEAHEPEPEDREPAQAADVTADRVDASHPAEAEHATEPAPTPHAPAPAPRRGSTVREPAPTSFHFGEAQPAPLPHPEPVAPVHVEPTPVVTESPAESEETSRPRRGWWSKRILGKG